MSSYEPVQGHDNLGAFTIDDDDDDDENFLYSNENSSSNGNDEPAVISQSGSGSADGMLPLELGSDDQASEGYSSSVSLFSWKDPWFPNILVVCLFVVPLTILWMTLLYGLLGQWWILTPFMAHALVALLTCYTVVVKEHTLSHSCWRVVTTLTYWIDIALLGAVYPLLANGIILGLWLEADGNIVLEYQNDASLLIWMTWISYIAVALRVWIGSTALLSCCCTCLSCPRCLATCWACLDRRRTGWTPMDKDRFKTVLRYTLGFVTFLAMAGLLGCLVSVFVHFNEWEAPRPEFYEDCDPLDTTECWSPFPSYRHMVPDSSTETGWRVNLHPRRLPPLKGGRKLDPHFLNEMDGFSTMAPILFYMDGLKEAVESQTGAIKLMGANMVAQSVTKHSITLLIDVTDQELVAHTAEIDYLDPDRPLVLMFPARPLAHNHHYAVAVLNVIDSNGDRLPQVPALTELLFGSTSNTTDTNSSTLDPGRSERYRTVLVPLLHKVAPWIDLENEPNSLQLLFDFHTASATSQLGSVRAVRDGTLAILNNKNWDWSKQVQVRKQEDYDCTGDTLLARTIYADMTLPWFLDASGPGHRTARLDRDAVRSGHPNRWGLVKFVVHIPCSIRNAIQNEDQNTTPVKAVMEYGHGLFFGLEEAQEGYLQKIAHENQYVITAMDFRGMSASDLLVVAKTLLTQPSLFEAVRDNLIQGYAAKFALQHFTQHALFETDWFNFNDESSSPPVIDSHSVTRVYYGNSQGGILGAGYTALAGPGLIDRAILGVPGTPFALVMSRSSDFAGYDKLLLLSMYNNRHVRILLSLVQMAWDSVEGSGVLAPPLEERFPPTILQAGLGDPTVPTQAAEALARAYEAFLIPNNPRGDVYGIPLPIDDNFQEAAESVTTNTIVTLTELDFAQEHASLPERDYLPVANPVHVCVRLDEAMIRQMTTFINTGQILDICENNGCLRDKAKCW